MERDWEPIPGKPGVHPEWEPMYRAGLSMARISELTGYGRPTIWYHLKKKMGADPSLAPAHLSNQVMGPARLPRPSEAWWANQKRLFAYYSIHQQLPKRSSPDSEASALGSWVTVQRREHASGRLTPEMVAALDAAAPWRVPQSDVDKGLKWDCRLVEVARFVATTGRWPAWERPKTAHEHQLGIWLHGRRQDYRRGKLSVEQVDRLNTQTPGWADDHRKPA